MLCFAPQSMYSLPSCAAQPPLGPFMWVHWLPLSHRWMCFCKKSRNGCHFSWHGGETNKTPCSFKEAGAGTSHWTQTPQESDAQIASTAKHSPFHAESLARLVLSCSNRKRGKVQSKRYTLDPPRIVPESPQNVRGLNRSLTNSASCMPGEVLNMASVQLHANSVHLSPWMMCCQYFQVTL